MSLVECVINVSEGRRAHVIDALAAAARTASGSAVLDVSSDPSHHRSVFTVAGPPSAVRDAVLALYAVAIATIDLRTHQGVHPRIGAVDVVPFVPLATANMRMCVELARDTAHLIADRYGIPVFLYEEAARDPSHQHLADLRRGGLGALTDRMLAGAIAPDAGPSLPHPSAGVSAIGARPILIAYNVNLASRDVAVARAIARAVRASGGGLPGVKAIGVPLPHLQIVQVSMNLLDYHTTSPLVAYTAVGSLAATYGTRVLGSEIVGLVPADALPPDAPRVLQLQTAAEAKILDERLKDAGLLPADRQH